MGGGAQSRLGIHTKFAFEHFDAWNAEMGSKHILRQLKWTITKASSTVNPRPAPTISFRARRRQDFGLD